MNVNQIEIALSQKISASSSNFDLLAASKALQLLKTNGVFVVSSYGGLPAAASNEGKIYFIEDIETVVWSNGTDWLRLLDKTPFPTELYAWGYNTLGKLGDGTTVNKCSPVREFCSATDWCYVSAGYCHSAAVKTSGELWSWGYNSNCQLGDNTGTDRCSPVREISSSTDWCSVCAGGYHTLAIKTSGQIWAWGQGGSGKLGTGNNNNRSSPVREFCSAIDWCQVTTAGIHSAAVKTSGQIWVWGYNSQGRLGDGTTVGKCSPVREICSATDWCGVVTSAAHTVAIKTSGEVWAWGRNTNGRLGDGTTVDSCSPIREFCSATNWCHIAGGRTSYRTIAIKSSGELWGWGNNNWFNLGDGTATSRCSPVREFCSATDWKQASVGYRHTVALKNSGQIWAWGNGSGVIGDGFVASRCSPVREFTSGTNWCQVSVGSNHSAAIKLTV